MRSLMKKWRTAGKGVDLSSMRIHGVDDNITMKQRALHGRKLLGGSFLCRHKLANGKKIVLRRFQDYG